MNKKVRLLTELSNRVPHLKQLHHDNNEYQIWRDKVLITLENLFGKFSREFNKFWVGCRTYDPHESEDEKQQKYIDRLNRDESNLKAIIDMQEIKAELNKVLRFQRFLRFSKDLSIKIYHESKDFLATIIAKFIKERTN